MSEIAFASTPPDRPARSRAATREVWLDRLARFPLSGLTPAQFCAIEAVSLPSFYAWRRRIAAEALSAATRPDPSLEPGPRLLAVRVPPTTPAVELVLPTGTILRLPPGCDLAWVRSLVA